MEPALKTIETKAGTKQEIKQRGILKHKYHSYMIYKYTHRQTHTQKYTYRMRMCVKNAGVCKEYSKEEFNAQHLFLCGA